MVCGAAASCWSLSKAMKGLTWKPDNSVALVGCELTNDLDPQVDDKWVPCLSNSVDDASVS